jgi:hypothetical protein
LSGDDYQRVASNVGEAAVRINGGTRDQQYSKHTYEEGHYS